MQREFTFQILFFCVTKLHPQCRLALFFLCAVVSCVMVVNVVTLDRISQSTSLQILFPPLFLADRSSRFCPHSSTSPNKTRKSSVMWIVSTVVIRHFRPFFRVLLVDIYDGAASKRDEFHLNIHSRFYRNNKRTSRAVVAGCRRHCHALARNDDNFFRYFQVTHSEGRRRQRRGGKKEWRKRNTWREKLKNLK